ncbi:cytosine permease [Arthrobacter livingstonensis]|uniref:Cytosine permease n=1 Tax=Arthrobacter livingstonensis TaxID=670078 RepID=A0A2V5M1E8_9MICC|nr:cytosine permease [Arthrobacter livingstonensis]PYI69016.1 cytosine permease [Arthrobacter livingstonensis]
MRDTKASSPGNDAQGGHTSPGGDVEQNLQAIPESSRTRSVSGQFWIWAGANLAPINWVLGALGIQLGLGFADTVTVLVAGNLVGMSLFGIFVLLGQRTGATGMVLARAAFGRRGNYLPSAIQAVLVIGWCAVNTWIILDLVMALMGKLGFVDADAANVGPKVVVAALIMAIQVTIAWFGYKAIAAFERWTVPPTIVVLIAMSAVAWFGMHIDWSYAGPAGHILHGGPRIAAMTTVMTVIGIGWGITWFTYAADYSRFVSRGVPRHKVYLASVFGQFLPVVWLGILGASLATKSGSADPGKLIVDNFGLLAIPVLFLVLHGPVATNILNIYTFSVAAQALDIKIKRRALNVGVGVLALGGVVFFVMQESFANTLSTWLGALVAWVAAWGGIMLVHYLWVDKRKPVGIDRLFDPIGTRRLPVVNWAGITALLIGIFSTWLFMYGVEPIMQGPIATAMGGIDLSWLAGGLVAAGVYAILGPRVHARYATDAVQGVAAPAGSDVVSGDPVDHVAAAVDAAIPGEDLPDVAVMDVAAVDATAPMVAAVDAAATPASERNSALIAE